MTHARNRWLGTVLAMAIAFAALLPFFATYNTTTPPSGLASIFGEKVLICTADGFKWMKWADVQQNKNHFPPSHYKCPLCYLAAHGTATLGTLAAIILMTLSSTNARYSFSDYRPPAFHLQSLLGSRAPPVFA